MEPPQLTQNKKGTAFAVPFHSQHKRQFNRYNLFDLSS